MYPLLLCSIITLAIIIDRLIFWARLNNHRSQMLVNELCQHYQLPKNASKLEQIKSDVIGRVLLMGIKNYTSSDRQGMQLAAKSELDEIIRYHGILKIMVSFSPLLGIFGTVIGIIDSFSILGDTTLVDPVAASGGLAEALITTAFGLAIAMLSLIAFAFFQSHADEICYEMNIRCDDLEKRQNTLINQKTINEQHNDDDHSTS